MGVADVDFCLRRRRRSRGLVRAGGLIGRGRRLALGRASRDQDQRERSDESAKNARRERSGHHDKPRPLAQEENSIGCGRLPPAL